MRAAPLRSRSFLSYQYLNVLLPELEGLSNFFRVTVPLKNSRSTAKSIPAVVQCELENMPSNPEPLQSAGEAAAKAMKCPPLDCWANLFLHPTMVATRTIRAVRRKLADTGQCVEYTTDHRRDRDRVRHGVLSSIAP
jgi:hypothetical protein